MTLDLTQILALAQSMGPWGWAIAAVYIYLRWRSGQPILPTLPAPQPAPAPRPASPLPFDLDTLAHLLWERLRPKLDQVPRGFDTAGHQPPAFPSQVIRGVIDPGGGAGEAK